MGAPATWSRKQSGVVYHLECSRAALPCKFGTTCAGCGQRIEVGDLMRYAGKSQCYHAVCPTSQPVVQPPVSVPAPTMPVQKVDPVVPAAQPVAAPVPGSLDALIASAVLPFIQQAVAGKTDADAVKAIAGNVVTGAMAAVIAEVESLRKQLEDRPSKTIVVNAESGNKAVIDGLKHFQFDELLAILDSLSAKERNVYLYGAASGGKTTVAEQIAKAYGLKAYGMQLGQMSTPSMLLGFADASGKLVETDFYRAYSTGGVLLADEYDGWAANLQNVTNTGLDNGYMDFPVVGRVYRHKDFIMLAAGNTAGLGANATYVGRNRMDAAGRERFAFLEWHYDTKLEKAIALAANPKADGWVDWVWNVRKTVETLGLPLIASTRVSIKGAQLLRSEALTVEKVADLVLFKGIDKDTRSKVLANHALPKAVR